ncbi:MAG: transposase [Edaphobacter sp.]|uniref:REP-associated tyrosine transposase n=1 Tax=Edaphobacter sp. TaxID=1934404 RepID=UPI0023947030|nr:transposase [Edaphobacter sp.]MDE1177052.1 transposase [Edaphobacter sp.]
MPLGLKRYQDEGDDHFITFSCYNREPYLKTPSARDTFLHSLELTRTRYNFEVLGYVVMPEHVHLLIGEPPDVPLSKALQALKLSASKRLTQRPFWQTRYYDFNVFTRDKRVEKLKYMHHNPVARKLVVKPEDWPWSTCRHYHLNEPASVKVTKPV